MHTHTQPFNGLLSGTTRVGRYQKKHSPTHTHPDHRTSFIIFLHLQRSMALCSFYELHSSLGQHLSRSSLVFLLALDPQPHTPCTRSSSCCLTGLPAKSCSLDPIPTWLLKHISATISPILCHNLSFQRGIFPSQLKHAVVTPRLKKPTLDPDTASSYRPISNLSFISKLLSVSRRQQITFRATNIFHLINGLLSTTAAHEVRRVGVLTCGSCHLEHCPTTSALWLILSSSENCLNHYFSQAFNIR